MSLNTPGELTKGGVMLKRKDSSKVVCTDCHWFLALRVIMQGGAESGHRGGSWQCQEGR